MPSPAVLVDRLRPLLALCAVLGGLLHAIKGAVLLAGGPDLPLVPTMTLLFSIGLFGLLRPSDGALGFAGAVMSAVGVVTAAAALGYQLAGVAPEDPGSPLGVRLAYAGATIAILLGLLLLGIARWRDRATPMPWRAVPLAVGVAWFPLEALTAVAPDGVGLFLAGLAWTGVGAAVRPDRAAVRATP
ncbi:MAG: hypothetical protein ACLGI3_15485 [Actinomycetes bacterium]